jgi:hypothetical protein
VSGVIEGGIPYGPGSRIRAIEDADGIPVPSTALTGADGSSSVEVGVDDENKALVTIDSVHRAIHEGVCYRAGFVSVALASSASALLRLTVGANKDAHVLFEVTAPLAASVEIREGDTFSAPGSALTEINLNRESANTPEVIAREDPTVNVAGLVLAATAIPAGRNLNVGGGQSASNREELILAKSTEYTIEVTNDGVSAADFTLSAVWYERD